MKQQTATIRGSLAYFGISLALLSLVVILHELGHFVVCALLGIKTTVFSVGFGPRIIGAKIGNTLFQIALFPLGGYVSLDPTQLAARPYYQQLLVSLSGVASNFLCTVGIFWYLVQRNTDSPIPTISTIMPDSPAQQANLHIGDTILAVDDTPIGDNVGMCMETVQTAPGKTITFTVERDGTQHDIPVTIAQVHPMAGPHVGYLGVRFGTIAAPPTSIGSALLLAIQATGSLARRITYAFVTMGRKKYRAQVTGPVGTITQIGRMVSSENHGTRLHMFLFVSALMHLNVGVFNLFPIPFLDGGRAVIHTVEALLGKPLSPEILGLVNLAFIALFIMLILMLTFRDIQQLREQEQQ